MIQNEISNYLNANRVCPRINKRENKNAVLCYYLLSSPSPSEIQASNSKLQGEASLHFRSITQLLQYGFIRNFYTT